MTKTQSYFDTALTTVATKVRQPVFVDNAVHYAKVEPRSDGKSRVTIEGRNAENYDLATEKTYSYVESESSITISHTESDGHTQKSNLWTSKGKNIPTNMMFGSDRPSNRLLGSTYTTTDTGLRVNLRNMKSRTLNSIGFVESDVHMGQLMDVGMRTTDLAVQLSNSITGAVTSVSIGESLNTANSASRRKHSNVFLATDFNNVNLITALRYISRHDSGVPIFNRYGTLLYVPVNTISKIRQINSAIRFGKKNKSPVDNSENRISVQGRQIALNEQLIITMDDRARQKGKFDSDVIENVTPIFDASITSKQQGRKVARKMLKANTVMQGALSSQGHPNQWDIRPGDVVMYDREKYIVSEASHRMSDGQSDFVLLSMDIGIDGVLQGILEGSITAAATTNNENGYQIVEENFSFFNTLDINILPVVVVTQVSPNGFLIGENAGRGRIGGAATVGATTGIMKIGLNKETPIVLRGEM